MAIALMLFRVSHRGAKDTPRGKSGKGDSSHPSKHAANLALTAMKHATLLQPDGAPGKMNRGTQSYFPLI